MSTEDHQLALPKGFVIEQYRLEGVLGKGGFGITYLAVDVQLGKKVAIKELMPDTIATRVEGTTVVPQSKTMEESWEWARERFLEEARALAAFSHPAIVAVHRLIEAHGTVYLVMEYIEGETYESKLRREGPAKSEAELMRVIGPLLSGLEEVHARGLLHRDIKPENILIGKRGEAVLIDFGAARMAVGATVTMTSIVSHGYSPFEQYQTRGKMGPWTDIYAMGAVMCRAITGEKPPVAADRVEEDEFERLSERWLPGYEKEFLEGVDWALEVKGKDRPKSIREWYKQVGESRGAKEEVAGSKGQEPQVREEKQAAPKPEESKKPTGRVEEALPRKEVGRGKRSELPKSDGQRKELPSPQGLATRRMVAMVLGLLLLVGGALAIGIATWDGGSEKKVVTTPPPSPVGVPTATPATRATPEILTPTPTPSSVVATEKNFISSNGMEMIWVEPGSVGPLETSQSDEFERITISEGYFLGKTEVTQEQWQAVMGSNPSFFKGHDLPVETVDWWEAMAYCRKLTERDRASGKLPEGYKYTLPTEEQWEYACRAGTTGEYAGSLEEIAWLANNSKDVTHKVGVKTANEWGFFDMLGNVSEWCQEKVGIGGRYGTHRGGNRASTKEVVRPGFRVGSISFLDGNSPLNSITQSGSGTGFRTAAVPDHY